MTTSERHADVIMMIPSYSPGAGALLPPRSHLADDSGVISLDGTWSFAHFRTAPAPFVDSERPWAEPSAEPATGDIDVPSHWVLREDGLYGRPAYTNVDFPFPVDPPYPPEENPVGDYRRSSTCLTVGGKGSSPCASTVLKARPPCGSTARGWGWRAARAWPTSST